MNLDETCPRLVVARDANEVVIDGRTLSLRRRRAMRLLLLALLEAARERRTMTCDDLCRAVWSGDVTEQTRARAYTTIRRMRQCGFARVLVTNTDGYSLRPDLVVDVVARDTVAAPSDDVRARVRKHVHSGDELRALLQQAARTGGPAMEARVIVKPFFEGGVLVELSEIEVKSQATSHAWTSLAFISDHDAARREVRRVTLEHARTHTRATASATATSWTNADLAPAGP